MSFVDRRNYQVEWRGNSILYRLLTSKSAIKANGISNTVNQRTITRHGQSDVVLLLDMASEFEVVEMTERARSIIAFITPSGLFEWLRMPFGFKDAPQIYQHLIDNALYGYMNIGADPYASSMDPSKRIDVFT